MNKFFKFTILLAFLTVRCIYSGVIISIDVPKEVSKIVLQHQVLLENGLKESINNKLKAEYLFSKADFLPHISLAFVNQEQLSTKQVEEKYPGLKDELSKLSLEFPATDISEIYEDLSFEYWPGKFEMVCGGSKKKNYVNVVLKAGSSDFLSKLSNLIRNMLEEKYKIKQAFPFSIHLTIGRLYYSDDSAISISEEFKEAVSEFVKNYSEKLKVNSIIFSEFKLKGHDGSEEVFSL